MSDHAAPRARNEVPRESSGNSSFLLAVIEIDLAISLLLLPLLYGGADDTARALFSANSFFLACLLMLAAFRTSSLPRWALLPSSAVLLLILVAAVPLPEQTVKVVANPVWNFHAPLASQLGEPASQLSLALSPELLSRWGTHIALVLVLFLAAVMIGQTRGGRLRIMGVMVASALVQLLYSMLALDSIYLLDLPRKYSTSFLSGTFVNRDHLATFLAMGAGAAFGLAAAFSVNWRTRRMRFAALACGTAAASLAAAVIFSGSRACTIALGVSLAIGLFAVLRVANLLRSVGVSAVVAASAVTATFALAGDALFLRFLELQRAFDGTYTRPAFWKASTLMGLDSPVTGLGPGGFEAAFPWYWGQMGMPHSDASTVAHPHNDWVEWFAQFGAIGVIAGCTLLVAWVFSVRRQMFASGVSDRVAIVGCIMGVAAFGIHALLDFPFAIPANAAAFAILAGLAACGVSQSQSRSRSMALSALVFVPIMLLSTWGFLHSTDTSGELSRWYPGERSDILIAKASEARGSGDYVTMRALVLKALKQRPGDPYLWLSLGSVPAVDASLQLDALDRAHALAPGSSFVAEGIVTTCARLRSELPSACCGRIDQMLKLTIGSQQETSARKLILLLGEQTGSFVAVQKILGPQMEQPVVCAAFDSGQRNLLLDWVRKNSGREALSRPVATRLMSLPKDSVWLRALEGSVDTVAAQHPELAMEYLKALAARGQIRTALLRADSAFKHQPVWLFISNITVMTSRDSLEHLADNMEKLALVTRGELSYFLAGWDNAARSEQWGTLSKALRSLQRFDGIPEVDLRLANALYNSGKLEDALALLERHRSRVDSNKALQEKLSDCYRRLGLVDKLRELEP